MPRERLECLLLLALYSKWCYTLGGKKQNVPNKLFIAFGPHFDTCVYLSANIGGAGELKSSIQEERFQWLKNEGMNRWLNATDSPMGRKNGQRVGHCSETVALTVGISELS